MPPAAASSSSSAGVAVTGGAGAPSSSSGGGVGVGGAGGGDSSLDERVVAQSALDAAEEQLQSLCASHAGSKWSAVQLQLVVLLGCWIVNLLKSYYAILILSFLHLFFR